MSDVEDMHMSEENCMSDTEEFQEIEYDLSSDGSRSHTPILDFEPEYNSHSSGINLPRQKSFDCLREQDIAVQTQQEIDAVKDILNAPDSEVVTLLLRHFKWNREKLIQQFSEHPERVCVEAGISSMQLESESRRNANEPFSCSVCFEETTVGDTFALGCGHRFCKSCWKAYLEMQIRDGMACANVHCMQKKCKDLVHGEAFKKLVSQDSYQMYVRRVVHSFVDDNPTVKWCPAPGCTNAVHCERKNRKEPVCCLCGFRFCFYCCDSDIGDHNPATCVDVEKWLRKASDESENLNWMMANTKKCPNCRSPIEKNGGCMHMVCRKNSGGCGFEFCWLCRGPWEQHGSHTGGYYSCNKYEQSQARAEDEKAQDAKTELEKYMFYFHRYQSHKNAGKIADQQRKNADAKSIELQTRIDVRASDTKFLNEAAEQLIENRRALEWSYVMGYYLDRSNAKEKMLFEYLQEDLEKHTNHLSELYERDISTLSGYDDFLKWKEEVANYTRVTRRFLENFMAGVNRGLTPES